MKLTIDVGLIIEAIKVRAINTTIYSSKEPLQAQSDNR